ncbi:hypothetical protein P0D88_24320 [Paraburkholderia sp. RL18-103-BIB-C]|jgi:hypothetical protein|uniref:hypothetical protein n=1 Tax=unclassified Paraburkholderia TaxID=2615204 RepID=UPI0038BA6591
MNHAPVESRTASTRGARLSDDHPDDAHLSAYNAAFSDLGLRFRWDRATLDMLKEFSGEVARITAYIERYHGHLHRAYDADFLAQLILHKKDQYYSEFAAAD